MSEWKRTVLSDLISIKGGFSYKGEYIGKGSTLLLGMGCVSFTETFLGSGARLYGGDTPDSYLVYPQDIVLATRQQSDNLPILGAPAIVPNELKGKRVIVGTNLYKITNNSQVNNRFLFWLLKSSEYQEHIHSCAKGSTVKMITKDAVESFEFLCPPENERIVIADILWTIDDKIDLLHRQNATLEKMAETLFRQWFIEEAKEEWEEILITDLFEIKDGTHDSPKEKEFGKKLITSKHLSGNSLDFKSAYYISDEDYQQINLRSKVNSGDILFSMIGTIGRVYLEQSDKVNYAIKNIGLFKTSQNPIWTYFTFLWLKSGIGEEFVHEYRSGSTQEYIALGSLRSIVFKISINRVEEFHSLVADYFNKIKTNQTQIRTLMQLRDELLPKLMSGEVRIV